jgi:signal transduction histidine kinase
VKPALPYSDAVRFLPEPTYVVTSEGVVLDANLAAMKIAGLSALDLDLQLAAIIECDPQELLSMLRQWSRSRSPVPGKLVLRTPAGLNSRKLNAWCARPGSAAEPALVILRCESDVDNRGRFLALNDQIDQLRKEVHTRQQIEAGLADAIAARDDFVAVAAHELRNPLNVFQLTLQLLYRISDHPGGDIKAILRKLKVQLDRINSLVERLLDVARIRSGKFTLELEPLQLGELAREVVDRFLDLHPDLPLTLQLGCEAHGMWDRLRLDQALSNIISNALKYGLRKPIEVTLGSTAEVALISVKDHGIGLMPGDADRIFDRFERAVPLSSVEGLGLGLWIAKRVIEAHDGTITAEGLPGQGATFTIRLPLPPTTS